MQMIYTLHVGKWDYRDPGNWNADGSTVGVFSSREAAIEWAKQHLKDLAGNLCTLHKFITDKPMDDQESPETLCRDWQGPRPDWSV